MQVNIARGLVFIAALALALSGCESGGGGDAGSGSSDGTGSGSGTGDAGTTEGADATADAATTEPSGDAATSTPEDTTGGGGEDDATTDPADTTGPTDPIDTTTGDPCTTRCSAHSACGEDVIAACERSCGHEALMACEDDCAATVGADCVWISNCFGALDYVGKPAGPEWNAGPYGTGIRDTAAPFVIQTLDGPWAFDDHWNGQDSYIFMQTQTGFTPAEELFAAEPFQWLQESPTNVHYFMMSFSNGNNPQDDYLANVLDVKTRVDGAIEKLGLAYGKPRECQWRRRVHYVSEDAWFAGEWIGSMLQESPVMAFAIDRFQKIREVGLLSLVSGPQQLFHTMYEAIYFDFEFERWRNRVTEGVTEVTLLGGEQTGGTDVWGELPSAEELAGFDTIEADLSQYCDEHKDSNCYEWDYKAWLTVRERPEEEANPDAETPCTAQVNEVLPVDEVMGTCEGSDTTCAADEDCGEAVCTGYVAQVDAVSPVTPDTLPCSCIVPGSPELRETTKTCKGDGTGYADCACGEQWEVARWITTYSREGRWVMDMSPFLPLLASGGTTRFHYKPGNPYNATLKLRFYNAGKSERASEVHRLFGGGGFGPGYSDKYEPMIVPIPAAARRVEVFAWITGHGFGGQPHNCAEFCNHTHHFTVNPGATGGQTFNHDHHPWIDTYYGCADQVSLGAVPNQFGTWTIGRGGWCPGMDVRPFVADITDAVTPGEDATITYKGLLDGKEWQEGEPGFGGSIWMTSYLVVYE